MIWFFLEYPVISGLIFSIILGLPVGLGTVWSIRGFHEDTKMIKDKNVWDDEWDLR